jgi:histidinol-phosphate/aromatic aminotransferase/cobyric acid decarboxylase-like protein
VANFLLVDLGSQAAARALATGLLARGLVPRTFGADHPLAGHLRFTVRDAVEDELLIEAVRELAPTVLALRVADEPSHEEPSR